MSALRSALLFEDPEAHPEEHPEENLKWNHKATLEGNPGGTLESILKGSVTGYASNAEGIPEWNLPENLVCHPEMDPEGNPEGWFNPPPSF